MTKNTNTGKVSLHPHLNKIEGSNKPMNKQKEEKRKDLVVFGINKFWTIYSDPKADAIQPRWWHKLIFWKKWNYQEWKIRREFKRLSEIMDDTVGR